jgi:hypothetical protein
MQDMVGGDNNRTLVKFQGVDNLVLVGDVAGLVPVRILFGTLNKAPGCLCFAVIRPG